MSLPVRKAPIHLPVREIPNRPVIIFVTICSNKRKPTLCSEDKHRVIVNSWLKADAWIVGGYVIMPDHIHFFCAPARRDFPELKKWVQYWKALASLSWPQRSEQPIWQASFWDTQIRSGQSYEEKWEYVRQNPVRKGLVRNADEWPFQGELNGLEWIE
jgi:putative transposase